MNQNRMLLIEDDEMMRDALLMKAEGGPWEVTVAKDVKEAELQMGNGKFDVIVTDYELPDGNGDDVLALADRLEITAKIYLHSSREDKFGDRFSGGCFPKLGKGVINFLQGKAA